MTSGPADHRFMGLALALARGRLGRTAPNPAVGCVLVREGRIVATGATAEGGRPHAERAALDNAGATARGCTAYVTLEPCSHHGQTPPCAEALIEAGIARVAIACLDRDPRVRGRGAAMLKAAGIAVEEGLGESEARPLYTGFFNRVETGRPLVFIDSRAAGYDGLLEPLPETAMADRLAELGEQGLSRLRVEPGTAFAAMLLERGLARMAGHGGDTVY